MDTGASGHMIFLRAARRSCSDSSLYLLLSSLLGKGKQISDSVLSNGLLNLPTDQDKKMKPDEK